MELQRDDQMADFKSLTLVAKKVYKNERTKCSLSVSRGFFNPSYRFMVNPQPFPSQL